MKKRLSDLFSISNNTIGYAQRAYLLDGAKGNSVKGEAIIFKKRLSGGMEYSESEYEIRQDCIVLTAAFDSEILLKYAYYYLLANKDLWNRLYVGTTRLTNLSQIDLGMIEIEYPSLSIQEKIIGLLDGISKARENREKSLRILSDFLLSYYLSLRSSYGRYWGKDIKVGNLVKGFYKKKSTKSFHDFGQIVPMSTGFELYAEKKYVFTVDTKCNPYFLSVALSASEMLHILLKDKLTIYNPLRLVSAIQNVQIRLPEDEVQREFENRYKQIEVIMKKMQESKDKLSRLFDILLYSLLLRGQDFNDLRIKLLSDNPLIVTTDKYTYDNRLNISSLKEYNNKRVSLYKYLDKGIVKQYFDSDSGKIKLVGRDTVHI